jgi:hypothetical protein
MGVSPAMAQGPLQCRKDCHERCEDDCYIDDGGMSPEAQERHRMDDPVSDEENSEETNMPPDEGGPDSSERMDPRDQKLHKMLETCVDSCQGDCMGKCLSKAGLGMLPAYPQDPEELQNIRDRSGRPLPSRAVKGHLFCSEGCSGDCFQLCERQVSRQLAAAPGQGAAGRGGARPADGGDEGVVRGRGGGGPRGGRGGRAGGRSSGGYAYEKDTVVLPGKLQNDMLFGSTLWQVGLGVLCLATLALGAWSGRRICFGKGRSRGAAMTPV